MFKRAVALIPALLIVLPALAQTPNQPSPAPNSSAPAATPGTQPPDPPLPKDPNQLMQLAARVNGLSSPDMKPWHLKANYQTYDADGKPKDEGVFEEWWAAPDKYKISYSSPSFNQVEYRNGKTISTTGDAGWTPLPEVMVEEFLVHPMPNANLLRKQNFEHFNQKMGTITLTCLKPSDFSSPAGPSVELHVDIRQYLGLDFSSGFGIIPTTCFNPNTSVVRLEILEAGWFALFNSIMQQQGHNAAEDVWVKNGDLPIAHVTVANIDFPATISDSEIAPAPSSIAAPMQGDENAVIFGKKIGGKEMNYPFTAKKHHIQGLVMLEATITATGNIGNLKIVSGPKELQQSTFNAIKTWKFHPFTLNGEPIEVRTLINVDYTISK
ncbi:MAG TPA: energy transducer TonB [Silvibacterium sp.]|nr:energy transducer TonB [Silvibacterium sp.]